MITETEYTELRAMYEKYETARNTQYPGRNCFTPEMVATLPERPSNEQLGEVEVFEWLRDKPDTYFAYVSTDGKSITTWVGNTLGVITSRGMPYRSNMGDERQHVTVHGSNGRTYHGVAHGNGMYIRLKAYKGN